MELQLVHHQTLLVVSERLFALRGSPRSCSLDLIAVMAVSRLTTLLNPWNMAQPGLHLSIPRVANPKRTREAMKAV
jgi:hypothetical protein